MLDKKRSVVLVFAEDDDDDFLLAHEALMESHLLNTIFRVKDGQELMDFLLHQNAYTHPGSAPRPDIILLDLNMPRKDGREALSEIKAHPLLRSIPVVVLTTSKVEEDIIRTYELGVSSFIRKPVTFEQLCKIVKVLEEYWFEIVVLPPTN